MSTPKASPAPAPAPAPAQPPQNGPDPSAGGCYVRDPITGALSPDTTTTEQE